MNLPVPNPPDKEFEDILAWWSNKKERGTSISLDNSMHVDHLCKSYLLAQGYTFPDTPKAGRNQPCPCGSGKKYKKCHGR